MCIHNRLLSLIYRIIFLFGCGIGLYLNSGIPNGELAVYMLIFYTIQSNVLCFIFFSLLLAKNIFDIKNKGHKGTTIFLPHFKGAVTMAIAVTFIIYHFILAPQFLLASSDYNLFSWQNTLVHYFVPIAVILDWIIFDEKSSYRWFDPILWLVIPITYFLFILVRARLGGVIEIVKSVYPYFFIDVDVLGWKIVLKNASAFILGFLVLGYVIFVIDKISFKAISWKTIQKRQLQKNLEYIILTND